MKNKNETKAGESLFDGEKALGNVNCIYFNSIAMSNSTSNQFRETYIAYLNMDPVSVNMTFLRAII